MNRKGENKIRNYFISSILHPRLRAKNFFSVVGGDGNPGFCPVSKEENVRLSNQNGSIGASDVTDKLSVPLSAKLKSTLLKEQERKQRELLQKNEVDGYFRGLPVGNNIGPTSLPYLPTETFISQDAKGKTVMFMSNVKMCFRSKRRV